MVLKNAGSLLLLASIFFAPMGHGEFIEKEERADFSRPPSIALNTISDAGPVKALEQCLDPNLTETMAAGRSNLGAYYAQMDAFFLTFLANNRSTWKKHALPGQGCLFNTAHWWDLHDGMRGIGGALSIASAKLLTRLWGGRLCPRQVFIISTATFLSGALVAQLGAASYPHNSTRKEKINR